MSRDQSQLPNNSPTSGDEPPTEQPDSVTEIHPADTGRLDYDYHCQHCGASYDHELITRIHITRSDDDAHRHHNGLMPEAEVDVVDDSGTVIESVSRQLDEMDPTTLTVDDFPADLTMANKHVLTAAAHHPDKTKAAIADTVDERLEDTDVDPPAYRTTCEIINRFYRPHGGDDHLTDLTAKQQAILISHLAAPEASYTALADMVGVAQSYPRRVIRQNTHILDHLRTARKEHDSLSAVIRSELPADDLATLIDEGLLVRVPIELKEIRTTADETPDERDTGYAEAGNHEVSWGSPIKQPTSLCAAPGTSTATAADNADGESIANEQTELDQTEAQQSTDYPTADDGTPIAAERDGIHPESVARADIKRLREKVAFLKQTFAGVAQTDSDAALVVSVAEQIEQQCEMMLESTDHS